LLLVFDFQVVARLKPGVTLDQANADLARMIPMLSDAHSRLRLQPNVRPLVNDVIGDVGRILWILLATVGLVLLIACANVANLFLVRAEGRHQELAVRASLGASRGRIARQLLAESLVLGLAGGAVGLLLARAGIALLRRLAPAALPRVDQIAIDPVVLLFALAISLLTGLMFGLIPVVRLGSPAVLTLKDSGRATTAGPVRQRTRNALVVAEVAMALVLLVLSGLMIRTFVAPVPPPEVRRPRLLPGHGQRARRRAGLQLDRCVSVAARGADLREAGPRVLGATRAGAGQAPGIAARLARDRRRDRQRARRRPESTAHGDSVFPAAQRRLRRAHDELRRPFAPGAARRLWVSCDRRSGW
jgi:FtsX-like permease family